MSVFKCKMCGGTIEFEAGATVGVCDSCGTKQTLPRLDDDRKANLYDRANHFRRNNEFDKAAGLYEQILNEDGSDAEAYWSLVLCRYGIEYVEDPATRKRVPTVNRAQYTSIFDDDNYKSALQYADGLQRDIYEQEARTINEIQKGILTISQKEAPYDVFICYKEADSNGRRTPDSVLANDLYHQLTQEGFRVFFSRITLEDKLGTAYEPYIFAALNSAKVMVVLGTKPEYFNAVWVKNEWSRYLSLVKDSKGKKVLIPAYRDMDPYDLPEEFSHLMAQDMSKLGFMQDLIRGIRKICEFDKQKRSTGETVVIQQPAGSANISPLLKRAFMFLEDGNFDGADEYCERVLDQDPENAQAYLGKLMAELEVSRQSDLADCESPFDTSDNYRKAVRFGNENLASELRGYIDHINERNENSRLTDTYNNAVSSMNSANTESAFKSAAVLFRKIPGFKDADTLADRCLDKAEVCRKDMIYSSAKAQMTGEKTEGYEAAIKTFREISGWKDTDNQIYACQRKIEEIRAREEAECLERELQAEQKRIVAEKAAAKKKRVAITACTLVAIVIAAYIIVTKVIIPAQSYRDAMALYASGEYEAAIQVLEKLGEYKDSSDKITEIQVAETEAAYREAMALSSSGEYEAAWVLLEGLTDKDSVELRERIKPKYIQSKLQRAQVGEYVILGAYEQDNNTANGKEDIEWLVLAKESNRMLVISRYALDCQQYNTKDEAVTWETSSLRKWLNGIFLDTAFTSEELAMIPRVTVSADKNPSYSTDPGNSTQDRVFLLSITEVNKYFRSDVARKCKPTKYAKAQGCLTSIDMCWWWLRSPGSDSNSAAYVGATASIHDNDGTVHDSGDFVKRDVTAVRPALWVNLES